jgi:hypothetical protein
VAIGGAARSLASAAVPVVVGHVPRLPPPPGMMRRALPAVAPPFARSQFLLTVVARTWVRPTACDWRARVRALRTRFILGEQAVRRTPWASANPIGACCGSALCASVHPALCANAVRRSALWTDPAHDALRSLHEQLSLFHSLTNVRRDSGSFLPEV